MEGQRFDQLSRRMARFGSRREVLKGLAGAVAATLVGGRAGASAQPACTPHYTACSGDGECCAGAVCQWGLCMPGCRIGGSFHNAWTPEPGNPCARCAPEVSTTGWSPANGGMACWGGSTSLCGSGPSTCQNGACVAGAQISCQPLTVCHEAGVCDPTTGLCSHPPAAAGKVCGGTESCLNGMHYPPLTCDGNGFCVGGQSVSCGAYSCGGTQCRSDCENDGQCAHGAVCRERECLYLRANGESCPADHYCASGHCVDGTCCATACEGRCEVCDTGTCQPKNCDDNLSCTVDSCDQATGQCVHTQTTTSCLIDGACYGAEQTQATNKCLVCDPGQDPTGWTRVVCGDDLSCTVDSCDQATGQCVYTQTATSCLIDDVCYEAGQTDATNKCLVCDPGQNLTGWTSVVCNDELSCTVDSCDQATGQCMYTPTATSCLIDGVCYTAVQRHPTGVCLVCDPVVSQDDWTSFTCCETSLDCENGAACLNGVCVQRVRGELTSATPTGRCGDITRARDLYVIAHGGGPLQIGVRGQSSGEGSLFDPLVFLHTTFNPADVCANIVAENDDGGCGRESLITLSALAAGEYTVVVGGFGGGLGTYTLTFGLGPGC